VTAVQQLWHCEQPYVDPYWAYVRTLLHFNGNTTDESTANVSYAASNGAVIASSGQLHGSGCASMLAGPNGSIFGTSTALATGTGALCIEGWFKDIITASNNQYIFLFEAAGTGQTIRFYSPGSNQITVDISGGGPAGVVGYAINTWIHFAVTRSGNNWTLWINGAPVQTWVNSTWNGGSGGGQIWWGSGSSLGSGLTVLLDSCRITVGVPRYTAPFVPMDYWPNRGP